MQNTPRIDVCPSVIVQSVINWYDTQLVNGIITKPLSKHILISPSVLRIMMKIFLKIVTGMFRTTIWMTDLKHIFPQMLQEEVQEHTHMNINYLFKSWHVDHCCLVKPEMTNINI